MYRIVDHTDDARTFRDDEHGLTARVTFSGLDRGVRVRQMLAVRVVFTHDKYPPHAVAEALRCAAVAYDYLGDMMHEIVTARGDKFDVMPDLAIDTLQAMAGEVTFTGTDAMFGPLGHIGDVYGEAAPW